MKSVNDLANLVLFIHIRCIIPTFKSEVLEIIGFENSDRSIVKTACLTKKTRFKTKECTDRSRLVSSVTDDEDIFSITIFKCFNKFGHTFGCLVDRLSLEVISTEVG